MASADGTIAILAADGVEQVEPTEPREAGEAAGASTAEGAHQVADAGARAV